MNAILEQVLEITGALLILAAFALAQFRGLDRHDYPYLLLNLVGAAMLSVLAAQHGQWGFLLLQGVWTVVAGWGVLGLLRHEGAS